MQIKINSGFWNNLRGTSFKTMKTKRETQNYLNNRTHGTYYGIFTKNIFISQHK